MFSIFYFPLLGTPTAEGNTLEFFEAGLDIPLAVYSDSEGTTAWAQPIVLNAAGEADGVIYVDPDGPALKVVYEDADGVAIAGYPVDFIPPGEILNVTTTSITTLTNAQIKALPTTPITLITAPASGLRIKVLGATLFLNNSAGVYTNVNTVASSLQIETSANAWVTSAIQNDSSYTTDVTDLTDFLHTYTDVVVDLAPADLSSVTGAASGAVAGIRSQLNVNTLSDAKAVQISIDNNGSGALTGGNAANSLLVTVYYALESLA